MKNLTFKIGLVIVIVMTLIALFAPFIAPSDLKSYDLAASFQRPSISHIFGLDGNGRDILTRIIYGSRISLGISIVVVAITMVVGCAIGLFAGYFGGVMDRIFTFISDVFLSFPSILLAIVVGAFVGPGIINVIVILSVVGWVGYARLVRGQVLALKEREFVRATQAIGVPVTRIFLRHLLPNVAGPIVVNATFGIAGVILVESTLSFLGIGVPIDVPSWGGMLNQGTQFLLVAPHLSIFPGLFIMLIVLGFNFMGDGLRDKLDPKK